MTKVVGVRFKDTGKTYYFDPQGIDVKSGDIVIVETARGIENGTAATDAMLCATRFTITDLANKNKLIHPDTLYCYNWVLQKAIIKQAD